MPFLLSQVAEARNSWVALYQRSFDVDSRTLSLIHLLSQLNQNVENALLFMSGQPLGPVTVSDENRRGLINTRLADKVVYTKNTLVKLDASVPSKKTGGSAEFSPRLTTNMLKNFRELFKQLFDFPLGLPRAFFQSAFHTYIKLNITPQPRDNETSVTISAPALPLTLEGVIESNNPRRIQSITIQAEVTFLRDATGQNGYEQERIIELSKGDTYFKSQFLLQITEPAKINVHVSFSDSESKKVWIDESASATLSVVCAFAAQ
ncbi:integrator complex subunit 7 [Ditylenchus destructor]|uniref:Integrator complex subunit 7 n=1 Tax=Ditylenchus destructor TaxID=166010 RepID=A0AAD4QTC6_9BILA|nr:integrator complex subunit 7 [Ditylenchus destructor]